MKIDLVQACLILREGVKSIFLARQSNSFRQKSTSPRIQTTSVPYRPGRTRRLVRETGAPSAGSIPRFRQWTHVNDLLAAGRDEQMAMIRPQRIRIAGLGILQVRKRAARMGRNPATGEAIKIKASKKVRATKELKLAV
jgi:hypothetical protein